MGREFVH